MPPQAQLSGYGFGVFELDVRTGELRRQGIRLKLQGQPIEVLKLLLENAGRLVTREHLREHLWPNDTFGDFDHGLNNAVLRIREVLGDSATTPRYVETLPRKGYRFIYPVEVLSGDATLTQQPQHNLRTVSSSLPAGSEAAIRQIPIEQRGFQSKKKMLIAGVFLAVAALAVVAIRMALRPEPSSSVPLIRSIAVLPFQNLSGDPAQNYVSEGLTDELITNLAHIKSIRVISRTSAMRYKDSPKSVPEIAEELRVDGIVEGSVRVSGDRVKITAQLVHGPSDAHLWAEEYERGMRDLVVVEGEVARRIIEEINLELSASEAADVFRTRKIDPAAYELYLQGMYWLRRDPRRAQECFERAIKKDPNIAEFYAGLSAAFMVGDREPMISKEAALRALALDERSGLAHAQLGYFYYRVDWNWKEAEREFKRAIELSPNNPFVRQQYALLLGSLGRHAEAITQAQIALELDPLSATAITSLSLTYLEARQYDRALELVKASADYYPDNFSVHFTLGLIYEAKQMYTEALAEFERLGRPQLIARIYAAQNRKQEALALVQRIPPDPYDLAAVYARLGDKERAFKYLEQAYAAHNLKFPDLNHDNPFVSLRTDPRFVAMVYRVGLEPYPPFAQPSR